MQHLPTDNFGKNANWSFKKWEGGHFLSKNFPSVFFGLFFGGIFWKKCQIISKPIQPLWASLKKTGKVKMQSKKMLLPEKKLNKYAQGVVIWSATTFSCTIECIALCGLMFFNHKFSAATYSLPYLVSSMLSSFIITILIVIIICIAIMIANIVITITTACRHITTMTKSHQGVEMSLMIKVGMCQCQVPTIHDKLQLRQLALVGCSTRPQC